MYHTVGVGTATPGSTYKLNVNGNGYFSDDLTIASGKDLVVDTSTLKVDGLYHTVGIGTTSTSTYKLNVNGTGYFSGNLTVSSGNDLIVDGTTLKVDGGYNAVGIGIAPTSSTYKLEVNGSAKLGQTTVIDTSGAPFSVWDEPSDSTPFHINALGNVGVGTGNPSYKLDVVGTIGIYGNTISSNGYSIAIESDNSEGEYVELRSNSDTYGVIIREDTDDGGAWSNIETRSGALRLGYQNHAGAVTISDYDCLRIDTAGGTCTASQSIWVDSSYAYKGGGGTWNSTSDKRLKTNIQTLGGALDKITSLRGVEFDWINPTEERGTHGAGFVAQEVEELFPHWVSGVEPEGDDRELIPQGDKMKTVGLPAEFDALTVEAFRELRDENDYLMNEVFELKMLICADHPEADVCNR